jgi:hypothetical protein
MKMKAICSSEALDFLQTARVIIQKTTFFIVTAMET